MSAFVAFINWRAMGELSAKKGDMFEVTELLVHLWTSNIRFAKTYFSEAGEEEFRFYFDLIDFPSEVKDIEIKLVKKLKALHREGRLAGLRQSYTEFYLGKGTSEKPLEFLLRVYGDQIKLDNVSLSEIMNYDTTLYNGLMRAQRNKEVDLCQLLKKPGPARGRRRLESPIPESQLDPDDPRDAALLRENLSRANVRKRKQKQRKTLSPS